uniref:class III lanthipeptide n=2 Tax=Metapseudomonas otitidis TaxID=319939 RepID=UPI00359398D8
MDSPALLPVAVMSLLMMMLPAALSASTVLALQRMGASTVMLPAWLPPTPVVTVTPVLARALVRVVTLSTLSLALPLKPPMPELVALEMVTL